MDNKKKYVKKIRCELYNDNFQNYKKYHIPKKAQLVISDIPYNLGNNAFASSPEWYVDGDNKKGESKKANSSFFQDWYKLQSCWIYALLLKVIDKRAERKRKSSSNDCVLCIPANWHISEIC